MLYYWLHVAHVFLSSKFFHKKVDVESDLIRNRRVSILDCEGLRYMANSRYLLYMDLIRYELLFRTKLYAATVSKGLLPILGAQKIIYKKPLKRWTKFSITLILEGWDDKWAYHRQVFQQNNEVCAIGYTKVAFWKNKKVQDMREILFETGVTKKEMNPSATIRNIFDSDSELLKSETRINEL